MPRLPRWAAWLFLLALPAAAIQSVENVLLDGEAAGLRFSAAQAKERAFTVGPWRFGPQLRFPKHGRADRIDDKRLNLYIVAPGSQHHSDAELAFDHNLLVNARADDDVPLDFDLFWAITLDPSLRTEFRKEGDLLLAAQQRFIPGDLYDFDDAPGAAMLRSALRVDSLRGLARYRNKDGSLPRVLIIQAGFALRASFMPLPPAPPSIP